MKRIAHLQPIIPHYREEFFAKLGEEVQQDIYIYEKIEEAKDLSFNIGRTKCKSIRSKLLAGLFLLYNPKMLLAKDYDVLVLMLNFTHLTTWLLLVTKWIHHKKIILWGQGISVRRYIKEESNVDWKLKLMMRLSDGVWLYMDKEKEQWQQILPHKPIVALHNTLSGVSEMVEYEPTQSLDELKNKYHITQDVILIFCARFTSNRRVDILIETIQKLNADKYGFVIIGAGSSKPDFTKYPNVYDFGALYDTEVKRELFAISNIYFQPGWVGLSIVEAMAYGLPIFTFRRSEKTLQCVEYSYIRPEGNGMIFDDVNQAVAYISETQTIAFKQMGENARKFVAENLRVDQMVENAMAVINEVLK